jgi:hypothetical protein
MNAINRENYTKMILKFISQNERNRKNTECRILEHRKCLTRLKLLKYTVSGKFGTNTTEMISRAVLRQKQELKELLPPESNPFHFRKKSDLHNIISHAQQCAGVTKVHRF